LQNARPDQHSVLSLVCAGTSTVIGITVLTHTKNRRQMSLPGHVTKFEEIGVGGNNGRSGQLSERSGKTNVLCSGRTGASQPVRRALLLLYLRNKDKTL
jgi:hypothetical protein